MREKMSALSLSATLVIIAVGAFLITSCGKNPEEIEGVTAYSLESDWLLSELTWSPDEHYIAATVETNQTQSIYILDLQTGNHLQIADDSDRDLFEARGADWSNDGESLVAFYPASVVGPVGKPEKLSPFDIVIIDSSSGIVLEGVWNGVYAAWGPGENEIVVVDSDTGQPKDETAIYLLNIDTNEVRELTSALASKVILTEGLAVSMDGLLAFQNESKLQVLDFAADEIVGERSADSWKTSPSWSPDGEILAMIEDVSSPESAEYRNGIVLVTPDGSCSSNPLEVGTIIRSLDWSPFKDQLVFSTRDPGKLYFLDLSVGVGKVLYDSFEDSCES
jgi:Tol biopolymer transport system component